MGTTPVFLDGEAFFAQIEDARLAGFGRYWRRARGDRAMPRRRDLDPTEFPFALPIVLLSKLVDDLPVFQLAGEEVNRSYDRASIVGLNAADLFDDETVGFIRGSMRVLREHRAARYSVSRFVRDDGVSRWAERLLMPLSEDGGAVDHTVLLVARRGEPLRPGDSVAVELAHAEIVNYWKVAGP